MRHVGKTVGSMLLTALLCVALSATVFAAEDEDDESVWVTLSEDSGSTAAQITTDATVTDGVLTLTYDSSELTYESVEVDEEYVAMYAVNAEKAGTVRISWVAPGEYAAVEDGAQLICVNFDGEAEAEDISLSGTANNADGETIPVQEPAVETVDTSELEETVGEAEGLNSSDYTEESWAALEEALEEGKAVLENPDATQEEVDAAAKKLQDVIDALKKTETPESNAVDTSALEEAIAKAEGLDSSDYTSASWEVLKKALEEGKAVLENAEATQEEVDAAVKNLNDAIDALAKASGLGSLTTGDLETWVLFAVLLVCAAAVIAGVLMRNRRATR